VASIGRQTDSVNRIVADELSEHLFLHSDEAIENLRAEGIADECTARLSWETRWRDSSTNLCGAPHHSSRHPERQLL
jgi:hypothetical protein